MVYHTICFVRGTGGIFRKQAAENANVAKVKTKKANKVATKRMKLAGKLLAENRKMSSMMKY